MLHTHKLWCCWDFCVDTFCRVCRAEYKQKARMCDVCAMINDFRMNFALAKYFLELVRWVDDAHRLFVANSNENFAISNASEFVGKPNELLTCMFPEIQLLVQQTVTGRENILALQAIGISFNSFQKITINNNVMQKHLLICTLIILAYIPLLINKHTSLKIMENTLKLLKSLWESIGKVENLP